MENMVILLDNGVKTFNILKLHFPENYKNLSTAEDNASIARADFYYRCIKSMKNQMQEFSKWNISNRPFNRVLLQLVSATQQSLQTIAILKVSYRVVFPTIQQYIFCTTE